MTRGLGFLTASAGTAVGSSSVLGWDLGLATHVRRPGPDASVLDSRFKQYLLGAAATEYFYTGMHGVGGSERVGDIRSGRIFRMTNNPGGLTPSRDPIGSIIDLPGRRTSCAYRTRRAVHDRRDGRTHLRQASICMTIDQQA